MPGQAYCQSIQGLVCRFIFHIYLMQSPNNIAFALIRTHDISFCSLWERISYCNQLSLLMSALCFVTRRGVHIANDFFHLQYRLNIPLGKLRSLSITTARTTQQVGNSNGEQHPDEWADHV